MKNFLHGKNYFDLSNLGPFPVFEQVLRFLVNIFDHFAHTRIVDLLPVLLKQQVNDLACQFNLQKAPIKRYRCMMYNVFCR